MDLISRKAVKEEIKDEWDGSCSEYGPKQIINDTLCAVDRIPTVPAVPLDKLCEWLAERYEPPYALIDIEKLRRPIDFRQQKEIWMAALAKWMEEQDGTD